MADKDIALLTKCLCAMLPYGVKILVPNDEDVYTLLALNTNKGIAVIGFEMDGIYVTSKVKIEDCKPLLRPMSDMTGEEETKICRFMKDYKLLPGPNKAAVFCCKITDWLNEHYFDPYDLAGKDLAKAVTKENNPYRD